MSVGDGARPGGLRPPNRRRADSFCQLRQKLFFLGGGQSISGRPLEDTRSNGIGGFAVRVRVLGAFRNEESPPCVIGVLEADDSTRRLNELGNLSPADREALSRVLGLAFTDDQLRSGSTKLRQHR